MGINANITVYGMRKPTLELELVEGGSLAANTTYYVSGTMGLTPRTYNSVGSVPSDVYEITTTDTAKSIKITQKTYRDIEEFSDNGDGTTNCYSPRHCLTTDDSIGIIDSSYGGFYGITWVDYNNFTINTPYINAISASCFTDTYKYNQPSGLARDSGMAYFVNTSPPGYTANRWTRAAYQTYNIENPTVITSLPTSNYGDYNQVSEITGLNGGVWNSLLGYGTPYVHAIDNITPQELEDEFIAAGFPYHCGWSQQGYGNQSQFTIMAAVYIDNDSTFTVNNAVVILGGEFYSDDESFVNFRNCSINVPISTFTGYFEFTATDCTFYNASLSNTTGGWIYGNNNRIYSIPRFGAYGDDVSTYYDSAKDTNVDYGIIRNKEFVKLYGTNQTMQFSYAVTKCINCTIMPLYWVARSAVGYYPDIYMLEDCLINSTDYAWHFRHYAYGYEAHQRFDFLNVNTDDPNNIKKLANNSNINLDSYFYRRLEFYVQSSGITICDASINIVDNAGNTYGGTTDASGYTYIDVVEQQSTIRWEDGTSSGWNPDYNTYYTDFEITISADGYYDDVLLLETAYGNEENNVALKSIEPVVYVDRDISGTISSNDISGSIEENSISGSIANNNLSGSIKVQGLTGTIEENTIEGSVEI